MRVTTTKANPTANGRGITKSYKITGTGSGADGGHLPDDVDTVSVAGYASDGADKSTSSHVFIQFCIDDDPGNIDGLIRRLIELRDRQRREGKS